MLIPPPYSSCLMSLMSGRRWADYGDRTVLTLYPYLASEPNHIIEPVNTIEVWYEYKDNRGQYFPRPMGIVKDKNVLIEHGVLDQDIAEVQIGISNSLYRVISDIV